MVKGIQKFKEYFQNYNEQYTLIGGVACELLMEEVGLDFRATKDLDIVLIIEALSENFGKAFWDFIRDGGYEIKEKSNGELQFYRFSKPKNKEYPVMIELFSKNLYMLGTPDTINLTPIHISDECSSLSAILLNHEYYNALLEGRFIIGDIPVLKTEYLILFKAKAYLDLRQKKENGEEIDSRNIKKHKNDIFRLLVLLSGDEKVILNAAIKEDISEFIEVVEVELKEIELNSLGIKMGKDMCIELLKNIYL